jgi:hypothetical protein
MLTRAMGMDILGGDKIRTKSAKSKQQRAGRAFGCTLQLYTGLCLAVLTLSQPDAQPAFCCEPTGCGPVEDEAMKCPDPYPLVLRRKDDSVVHVNMPCNRWTCSVRWERYSKPRTGTKTARGAGVSSGSRKTDT